MENLNVPITVAYGDGIGLEIMDATLSIIQAAGARLDIETIAIGESVYLSGNTSGIEREAWDSLRRTKIFLKSPITTPQGGGFKSLNVTVRKTLGLYANVRPSVSYHPFVATKHPVMDMVFVREIEVELYAGIEHRHTREVYQCIKLLTRPGCEKIVRYAFEYARQNNRKKVSCFTKDNIMKMTDGLFHRVFDEIAAEYPKIENEHWIVDIGAAKLADTPEKFDVVVMPNLYGDILSDVAAQIAGSVGLAGSANIGEHVAMFEAIHGSAPDIAGQNIANPSGLIHGAIMMLAHIGQRDVAEKVHNAWLRTIEEGIHTPDVYKEGISTEAVGTREFAAAVIERLGQLPEKLKVAEYPESAESISTAYVPSTNLRTIRKETVGVDIFLEWSGGLPSELGEILKRADTQGLQLQMITNRGVKVYPEGMPETFCTDHWRCRFHSVNKGTHVSTAQIVELLTRIDALGLELIKLENLCTFDGELGYSLGQGQ